ncbi:MAG: S41 family peptidase [Bdellovibrionota bacterium]
MRPLKVSYVWPDSKAFGKIFPGDVIVGINDKEIQSLSSEEFDQEWKLHKDKIHVLVKPSQGGESQFVDLEMESGRVPSAYVSSIAYKDHAIAYIRISSFNDYTTKDLMEHREILEDSEAIIIDVRGNPGGVSKMSCQVAGLFLEDGVCKIKQPNRNKVEEIGSREGDYNGLVHLMLRDVQQEIDPIKSNVNEDTLIDVPLVVLVNSSSASAAEALTMTLQQHNRAIVVGEPSFGKGITQAWYSLKDINSIFGGYLTLTLFFIQSHKGKIYQADTVRRHIELSHDPIVQANQIIEQRTGQPNPIREKDYASEGHVIVPANHQKLSLDVADDPEEVRSIMKAFSSDQVKTTFDQLCKNQSPEECEVMWSLEVAKYMSEHWPTWPYLGTPQS